VLYLRAGTYRETLQPPRSGTATAPITIAAFPGETVTLSGCDEVAGPWIAAANGIHRADVGWDLGAGYNQLFVDGLMQHEARHPNHGPGDLLHPSTATVTVSNTHTATSASFAGLPDLTGARFYGGIGQAWAWQTAVIAGHNASSITLDSASESTWWWPNYAKRTSDTGVGFVYGKLSLLDADGEWFLQADAAAPHTLHLRIAGGAHPALRLVELKRRNWCIDLNNVNYITVRGVRTRGGAIRLNGTGNTLADCDARHLSHFLTFKSGSASNGGREEGGGVVVAGAGNTVRGCTIGDTAGSGIVAAGRNHLLTRNHIYNIDYSGTYAAPLVLSGESHRVTFNTVHDTGRDILRPSAPGSTVMYNDLSGCGHLAKDLGVVYVWGSNATAPTGAATRIAYNWIHDGNAADPLNKGVYLDNGTRNFQVDHNVIWNFGPPAARTTGIRLNAPADGHELHHNTLFDCLTYNQDTYSSFPETNSDPSYWTAATHHLVYRAFNNLVLTNASASLEDPAQRDFRPRAGTGAVNPPTSTGMIRWTTTNGVTNVPANFKFSVATKNQPFAYEEQTGQGVVLPGINDGFAGATPDSGAYEFGGPFWKPGVDGWAVESAALQPGTATGIGDTTATLRGTLVSAGLPSATVQVFWGTSDGGTDAAAWQNRAPVGTFTGSFLNVAQAVANLTPGTNYRYRFRAVNPSGEYWSELQSFTTGGTAPVARISNLSVRTSLAGGQTLIVGFVTDGAKPVLVRGVGPGMATVFPQWFAPGDVMADPRLELYNGADAKVDENDNWNSSLAATLTSVGAFPLTPGSKDAAFVATINGRVTAQLKGTGNGVVLVDAYDTTTSFAPRLKNVSARNRVGTGANILIAGFVIGGNTSKTVLIRGIGPALHDVFPQWFTAADVLPDPKLELFQGGTKLVENDNWDAALAPVFVQVGAYGFTAGSKDAALRITLPPGDYTAQLSGVAGTTGEGVIEVYEVGN
jgi:hypothetical protein